MISFKNLPNSEKPRERLLKYGIDNLSNEELIMIILGSGTRKVSVKEVAYNLLSNLNSIRDLKEFNLNKFMEIEGIGKIKAINIMASLELGRRVYEETTLEDVMLCTNPSNIISYFNYLFKDLKQEVFYVIYLDNKKKYLDKKLLFKGSISLSVIHPREIFKEAYLLSASYIICLHNHPSGDPRPSREDIMTTEKLKEIGNMHGIFLIDHIIIGNDCYYSFYEDNKM